MTVHTQSDIATLQAEIAHWSQTNFPNNQPHHPLLGVAEEVGELSHAHLKQEQGIRGLDTEHYAAKCDAVGDIFIYLADYCSRNRINMAAAIYTAWDEVKRRDWQKHKTTGTPTNESNQTTD